MSGGLFALLSGRLAGRDRGDRLKNAAGDLVGVALRIRAAILEVAFVAAVDEAVRDADGRTAVSQAVAEFVDRLGLVETGEAEVVVRSVNGDVLVLVFIERGHELLEVVLAADFAHVFGREVGVHSGAVPVDILAERFAMIVHIHAVLLAEKFDRGISTPDKRSDV